MTPTGTGASALQPAVLTSDLPTHPDPEPPYEVALRVENRSPLDVDVVHTIEEEERFGQTSPVANIPPGQSKIIQTYPGHAFIFQQGGRTFGYYKATNKRKQVFIFD